ncbi:MAG: bifunctional 5,10-methylenetetrahydrofolate dehydrogenase/5,10-methenyltetrahydrofolate cyclohydrolase, partial [Bacteroidota bacterium]
MSSAYPTPLILDGNATAEQIREELRQLTVARVAAGRRPPHLTAVLVGNDGGSETYVAHKIKACAAVGFGSELIRLEATTTQVELMAVVESLNQNPMVDGYIVQLPLPDHLDAVAVNLAIAPEKDVDGFHPVNLGRMALGLPCYQPATPSGILELIRRNGIDLTGMHAVVLGRSAIVGSPLAQMLSRNAKSGNCTVTLCHSKTKDIQKHCLQADLLVAALGKPGFVTADMVRPGAVVIDVGTTRVADPSKRSGYALRGDV